MENNNTANAGRKKFYIDCVVIGFALFAVFFGAGNLIFPAAIGAKVGTQWPISMLGIILISIVFPIMALIAVSNAGNSFRQICKPVGLWYYLFANFMIEVFVVVGTNLPRTAATTYEIGIEPLFPQVPMWAAVIVYFLITYYIVFDKSGIVDKIGKVLTPALLVVLAVIIIKGFITPLGSATDTGMDNVLSFTFTELYSAGDIFSGLLFSTMFITTVLDKGYRTPNAKRKIMTGVGIVAGILFLFVYGGLLILGVDASTLFPADVERTALLAGIVQRLLGASGNAILAVSVALACLSTSSGLIVIASDFFNEITKNKIPYKIWAAFFCVLGGVLALRGVEVITAASTPVFLALYPSAIVLSVVAFFRKKLPNMGAYKYAVIFTLAAGILDALQSVGVKPAAVIIQHIPLGKAGFGWVIPAVVGFIIGAVKYKIAPPAKEIETEQENNILN